MEETTAVDGKDPAGWVFKLNVQFIPEEDGACEIRFEWDESDPDFDYWNSLGEEGRRKFLLDALRNAVIRLLPDADVSCFLE